MILRTARRLSAATFILTLGFLAASLRAQSWTPLPVADDPLPRMPGTQPGEITLENPADCLACHSGFNPSSEPGHNWQGSMMSQSTRDFIWWSAITVASQDSIWALGNPNATDICLRCHVPKGWLEGRSDPTNASLFTGADFDGVQCDFCHRKMDPFFESADDGSRESGRTAYWDETGNSGTPSGPARNTTYMQDLIDSAGFETFSGLPFFDAGSNAPFSNNYTEDNSGQYFMSSSTDKRGPFADAGSPHNYLYSRHHKSKFFCSTCHDVSNTVLANLPFAGTNPGDGTTILPTEANSAHGLVTEQRTFSEFMLSDYGMQGGAPGVGPFRPGIFQTTAANNNIRTCQDCHMRDVMGKASNQSSSLNRPGESTEHPRSGQPQHDLTGGSAFVPWVLASTVPGSPNYDPNNEALLGQGSGVLTLDLTEGLGVNPTALLDGVARATRNLQDAARFKRVAYSPYDGSLTFRVRNNTGHKLLTGYPEGRRMWVNIKAYDGSTLLHEVNPYDATVGTLKGLANSQSSPALGPNESHDDDLVYRFVANSSLTGETETSHLVLADGVQKDNRIPPKGFRINQAAARMAEPARNGSFDPSVFTAAEYAGGYDQVDMTIVPGADRIELSLYYQTTSREYIEFLRDEINGTGVTTLASPTPSGQANAYIVQSDPYFAQLKAWGDTLFQIWDYNKNVPGAAPISMTTYSDDGYVDITSPSNGNTLDCRTPWVKSSRPVITWDRGDFDKFRAMVAWDPSFSPNQRIDSGERLVKRGRWRPGRKVWRRACERANPDLYIRVFAVDRDVQKQHVRRRSLSDVVTVDTMN